MSLRLCERSRSKVGCAVRRLTLLNRRIPIGLTWPKRGVGAPPPQTLRFTQGDNSRPYASVSFGPKRRCDVQEWSCVSIPANIAEGCGRNGDAELARFLQIAMGSASELEYHLMLSRDLGLLTAVEHKQLTADTTEVKRMLTSFIQTLKANR